VNVIAWNSLSSFQLASRGDSVFMGPTQSRSYECPAAQQQHHLLTPPSPTSNATSLPITSVAWSPKDESGLSVSSADYRVTVWDFMVKDDCETEEGFPSQLYRASRPRRAQRAALSPYSRVHSVQRRVRRVQTSDRTP
jgi:WD40 repeat protein